MKCKYDLNVDILIEVHQPKIVQWVLDYQDTIGP